MKHVLFSKIKKPKIYYGWYIVFGLGAVGMVSTGMGGNNLGLFVPPMTRELGISQVYFGWAYSARLIGFCTTSWFIGILLDRYGARIPMAITGVMAGLVMVGLSYLQAGAGWQLVALFFIMGIIGMEGGGGNLYQSVPLSRWFILKRGKAMSLAIVGTTVGIFIFSPLAEFFIANQGWRSAWFILGCIGSIVIVLVALLVIRKDPQSMGLQPDGFPAPESDPILPEPFKSPREAEYSWSRPKAIRTRTFWALVTVHGLRMLSSSTIHVFRIPFFIEQGIAPDLVAWAISLEAVVAAISSVVAGRAVDRLQPRFVAAVSLILFIIMFVVTMLVTKTWHVFVATALFGASAAGYAVSQNTLWPNYFGSANIGSIRGLSIVTTLMFSTIGAPFSGAIKDATGSYMPAWIVSILLLVVATIVMLLTLKPKPH